jgi:hypothetical protein
MASRHEPEPRPGDPIADSRKLREAARATRQAVRPVVDSVHKVREEARRIVGETGRLPRGGRK